MGNDNGTVKGLKTSAFEGTKKNLVLGWVLLFQKNRRNIGWQKKVVLGFRRKDKAKKTTQKP